MTIGFCSSVTSDVVSNRSAFLFYVTVRLLHGIGAGALCVVVPHFNIHMPQFHFGLGFDNSVCLAAAGGVTVRSGL